MACDFFLNQKFYRLKRLLLDMGMVEPKSGRFEIDKRCFVSPKGKSLELRFDSISTDEKGAWFIVLERSGQNARVPMDADSLLGRFGQDQCRLMRLAILRSMAVQDSAKRRQLCTR